MLKQHDFYVYHDGDKVMARMGDRAPMVVMTCKPGKDAQGNPISGAQVAHDEVQKIVNPTGIRHDDPRLQTETPDHREPKLRKAKGFHHPAFQDQISANCEPFVRAAYDAAKKA